MFKYQNSSFRVKNLILLEAIRHLHISHSAPYLPPVPPPPPNFASPLFFISPGSDYSHPKRNRPLSISKNPDFQNEARCTTFLVKMSFICMRMKNDFHIKGWAPTLVLKQRPGGTRKWPIENLCHWKILGTNKVHCGRCASGLSPHAGWL